MTPEQRRRAGQAAAEQIKAQAATPTSVARMAGVSPSTLLAFLRGDRWPSDEVQRRIEDALGWPSGQLMRQAAGGSKALARYSDLELAAELLRRLGDQRDAGPRRATHGGLVPR